MARLPSFAIREAIFADAEAIASIYRPYVEETAISFEVDAPSPAEMAYRIGKLRENGYPFLVAIEKNMVSGYAYASAFRPRAAYDGTVESSVYVSRDRHGEGIGTALLAELIRSCVAAGRRQMIAVISDPGGNRASLALHRSLGFTEVGTFVRVGMKFNREWDVLMLQRELQSSLG
jgi:phosphinothricin acetyltransferase